MPIYGDVRIGVPYRIEVKAAVGNTALTPVTFMLIRRDRIAEVETQTAVVGFPAIRDDTLSSQDARLLLFIQPPGGGGGTVAFTQNSVTSERTFQGDVVFAFEPVA